MLISQPKVAKTHYNTVHFLHALITPKEKHLDIYEAYIYI